MRGWAVALLSRLQLSSVALTSFTFGIFLPFIRVDLQLSPLQAGALQGIWWIAQAVLSVPCGVWFSRFRPVPLTLVSLVIGLPFLFLQGFAHSFGVLFLARLLFVVAHAIATPARPLLLQQWVAPQQYAFVNAVGLCQHSILLGLAVSTSAWLITAIGSWRLAYGVQGLSLLLQTLAWILVARERYAPRQGLRQTAQEAQESPLQALRRYPQGWLLGLVTCALSATWTAVVTFLPSLLLQRQGMTPAQSAPLLGFLYYGLIPASLLGGWLARRVTNRRLLLWIPALLNVVLGFALTLSVTPWVLILCLTALGITWITSPVWEVLPFEFPGIRPREVAVVSSMMKMLMGLGFALGPVVVGAVAQWSGSLQIGMLALVACTGVGVLAGLLYPRS